MFDFIVLTIMVNSTHKDIVENLTLGACNVVLLEAHNFIKFFPYCVLF